MDLLEARGATRRHPWELSRARAVERIVRRYEPAKARSILDWGCGDGYTGRFLLERLPAQTLVGVDPHLTEAERETLARGDDRIRVLRDGAELSAQQFDLILLCDVIEHVPDDVSLVEPLVRRFLAPDGLLVVTVPAFQALFTAHDVALKHYRRYRLTELESVLERSGLEVRGSGYLFGSLLPARALSKLLEQARGASQSTESVGLAAWRGGDVVSSALGAVLSFDNSLLLGLARLGLKIPGLSAWAACGRRDER